jgi:hypothetical protein
MKHPKMTTIAAIAFGTVSAVTAAIAAGRSRTWDAIPAATPSVTGIDVAPPIPREPGPTRHMRRMIDLPREIPSAHQTGRETAERVGHLLRLRSRLDRVAWNTLSHGPLGTRPMPGIGDWTDRCMFLVSVGIAFEDMPEVLDQALADLDGTSARGSLLHRTVEAYSFLGAAQVPARWNHDAMEQTWRELCEAVAEIIGQEPDYGTALAPPPKIR